MFVQGGIAEDRPVIVYQKLTLPGESTIRTILQQLAQWPEEFSDLSIVVLPRPVSVSPSSNERMSS
jgi:precorrin-6B methylase 1